MKISNCQLCGEEKRTGVNHRCNLTKLKPLSQMLAEVEPEPYIYWSKLVDRASHDKLKAIAVELAKGLEFYADALKTNKESIGEPNPEAFLLPRKLGTFADVILTTARKMLGDK